MGINLAAYIKSRKSVRTYDGRMLTGEDRERLEQFASGQTNPYGIPIVWRFLEPEQYGLKSPVLSGETLYLVAKTERVPHFEEALGYAMEAVVLYAWSLGIGTVWIGGTMNREKFEKAMELKENEVMPCVTPVGYPAKKRALREVMMRKGVKADWRYELRELVFEEEIGRPVSHETAEKFGEVLEMIRWAPSAVNKQPWRLLIRGNQVHFYEKQDRGYVSHAAGDLQRIDIGIAMYHFVSGMEASGKNLAMRLEDPQLRVPENMLYTATWEIT